MTSHDLPGLPEPVIRAWLAENVPDLDNTAGWRAELIAGGLSNLTFRLKVGDRGLVLRRPPLGHLLPRAHDVAREYRVMRALTDTPVPVPPVLGLCTDPDVIGAPFYVMEEIAGTVFSKPEQTAALGEKQRGVLGSELVKALAQLHSIEPAEVGLEDFGRRGGYCNRQINTWGKQWERSRTRQLPDMDRLLAELSADVPQDSGFSIVHGDYRLDNTLVTDPDGTPQIAAVIDWELSTLGDPLVDLAMTMTYWHDQGDEERAQIPLVAGVTALPGFPTAQEFATTYAALRGQELAHMPFYLALGAMKIAVIMEGIHTRFLAGGTVGEGYSRAGQAVPILAARGLRLLHGTT
jgi:aminoglycoside phosphotransferase (APT) family kinase protein